MKVEATVDVGNNLTSLIQQLAQQIGIAADKVFPWYVQQAYLQGITTAVALVLAVVVFGVLFTLVVKKADWDSEGWIAASVFSGVVFAIAVGSAFVCGPQQVRKMLNPQFYAVTMLAEDIGKMRGK